MIWKLKNNTKNQQNKKLALWKDKKIDRPLASLIRNRRERIQISSTRNEKGDITTDTTEIQKSIWDYYEQIYAHKLENLEEMDKFLEIYYLPSLNQEETNSEQTNNWTCNKDWTCNKNSPNKKSWGPDRFTTKFYQTYYTKKNWYGNCSITSRRREYALTHSIKPALPWYQSQKRTQQKTPENFRPISLMNMHSKILNKMLVNAYMVVLFIRCWGVGVGKLTTNGCGEHCMCGQGMPLTLSWVRQSHNL